MVPLVGLSLLLVAASSMPVEEKGQKEHGIDIYSFHINSEVRSRYAMTVITSRVVNLANESREVNFHVEIPKHAFISKFSMTIDGQMYDGVVKKKAEAQQQYDQAVSRGQSAGLVSSVGRTLEEFKTSVTVAAHKKVTFELTYEQLLKRRLGHYELLIKAKPTQVVKDFKIDVQIHEKQGIRFLDTRGGLVSTELSRIVNTTLSDKEARVLFAPTRKEQQQCPGCTKHGINGDLLIVYDVNRPSSWGDLQISHGYFVHYFAPTDLVRMPKNVVFIIDQSGSMHGRKIEQTRQALLKILGDIAEEDHFALITFDDRVQPWKKQLVKATANNLEAAQSFVRKIRDRGGSAVVLVHNKFLDRNAATDINAAVLEGVRMLNVFAETKKPNGSVSILILLTDGDPTSGVTNLDTIQANVREAIGRRYTLYCLGFGFDVNYEFLEKMALQNGGVARRIYPDSDADVQLQGFYEEVATPLLLDIQMSYTGVSNVTQTSFGHYYNGSEIIVAGRISDNDLKTLTAAVKAHSKSNQVEYEEVSARTGDAIDSYIFNKYIQRLWAYLTVQQLLEKEVLVTGEEKQAVTDRALDLCLKYSFVTPLTSMVVTKPEGEGSQVLHKPKQGKPSVDVRASKRTRLRAQAFVSQFSDSDTGSLLVSRGGGRRLPGTKQSRTRFKVKNLLRNCPSCHPKVVTINQSLRILVPSAEQNLPLCFDVPVPSPLTYILLEDPKTGLVVLGKVGTSNQKGFQRVSIHAEKGGNVTADTSHIEVSWGEQSERLSWTQSSATHQSNGLLLHKQDDVLEVTVGETQVDILLHKDGSDHILWPAVKQHHLGSSAKGLMGQNRVSYEEKKTSPSVILEVQGHQHVAIRESAVDYSTPSKPTVSCWLLPHQSILQGELSAITVREP